MNKGQGSIGRTNKVDAVVIPPPTVTGADNGLTLLAGIVELGGLLIKNTVVNSGLFLLSLGDAAGTSNGMVIDINNTISQISIGDTGGVNNGTAIAINDATQIIDFVSGGFMWLLVDAGSQQYGIGDLTGGTNGVRIKLDGPTHQIDIDNGQTGNTAIGDLLSSGNGTVFGISDGSMLFIATVGGSYYLNLDIFTGLYQIGDISNVGNSTKINVRDSLEEIELTAGTSPAVVTLKGTPAAEIFNIDFAASPYFTLDPGTGSYFMGDLGGVVNQTTLTLSDSVSQAAISSLTFTMLFLDMVNGIFQLGASAGGTANMTYFEVNDALQKISTNTGGVTNGILLDFLNQDYQIGDYAGSAGGTYLRVNDANKAVTIQDPSITGLSIDFITQLYSIGDTLAVANNTRIDVDDNNRKIRLNAFNGAGVNTLPTLSPFAVSALQPFANNAAAVVGGLGVGDFYRLSVAGTSAVMVVE